MVQFSRLASVSSHHRLLVASMHATNAPCEYAHPSACETSSPLSFPPVTNALYPPSKQFQMSRYLINHALGRRAHAQHRRAPTRNLRSPRIVHDVRTNTQTDRLRLQHQQVVLALDLQRDFGLAVALPAAEDGRGRGLGRQGFVAC